MPEKRPRNAVTLERFVAYCKGHPEERFWQALRNFSGYPFVSVGEKPCVKCADTYYLET